MTAYGLAQNAFSPTGVICSLLTITVSGFLMPYKLGDVVELRIAMYRLDVHDAASALLAKVPIGLYTHDRNGIERLLKESLSRGI